MGRGLPLPGRFNTYKLPWVDPGPVFDNMGRLREVYPNTLNIERPLLTRPLSQSAGGLEKAHEAHDEAHEPISWSERRLMEACSAAPQSTPELLTALGYAVRTGNFKRGLKRLIAIELLEMSMPGKPRSKSQKYRLTVKGRAWLTRKNL
ncbi:MAG: hypothetical protein Q7R35_11105 [Elusimicrobiota bacterium]|nr:hypothetical protein [Elusimicrobiota bacterium]